MSMNKCLLAQAAEQARRTAVVVWVEERFPSAGESSQLEESYGGAMLFNIQRRELGRHIQIRAAGSQTCCIANSTPRQYNVFCCPKCTLPLFPTGGHFMPSVSTHRQGGRPYRCRLRVGRGAQSAAGHR